MDPERLCPYCAEPIRLAAIKCRYCGTMLNGAPPASASKDEEHLRYLQTGHYAVGAITAFFSCLPLIHIAFGIAMVVAPDTFFKEASGKGPPPFMGWMIVCMGGLFVACGWTLAILIFMAGRAIGRRRRHLFCIVVAVMACLFMPFGTLLGVFSLITLNRPEVKAKFDLDLLP